MSTEKLKELASTINDVFVNVGLKLHAEMDDESIVVRDMMIFETPAGDLEVLDCLEPELPPVAFQGGDLKGAAGHVCLAATRKMIANALG